ncbi:Rv0361 family membrane protein [Micromonospora auratinigra]|uniref:DUF4878 domain-containing protein n=1 Tax=Micromonospora auratinigra TaxID=261654 RepID=A0A1A8ZRC7_9ACTN|nr:nuclear transport factor 2 family protein [Micromonospora auratinigra]SBT46415.1 hypothetical protein GA0070611_3368 [Micromonospora auratinigra]
MTYQPAMASPPKRSNTTRTVLIVVGVVLALCCAGGAVGGFFVYRAVKEATGPARDAVDTYARALIVRDYPKAYAQLCAPVRNRVSEADFVRQQSAQPELNGYGIVGLNVQNTNGRVRGSASVRYDPRSGTSTTLTYVLVKEDGAWRICE